jgi:hypothetical protein
MRYKGRYMWVLMIFGIMLASGCSRNCSSVVCGHNQVCNNNTSSCFCRNGYEGETCDSPSYKRYINITYSLYDACGRGTGASPYIQLTGSSDISEIAIYNILGLSTPVTGYIISTADKKGTYIQIPSQPIGAVTVDGYGNYTSYNNRGKITLSINYNDGLVNEPCTLILTQI